MTNTNITQHPGTTLGTTYADVRRALNTGKAPLAKAILTYLRTGTNPTPGTFTPNQIRAAAAIIGISHISEEARFPGAAKLARALLKKIADKKMTFQEAFSDKWFPMVGSAGGLQGLLTAGDAGGLDDVLAGMSDSSGEEESSSESSDDEEAIPLGSFREEDKRRSSRLKSKETSSSGEGSPIRCRHCGYSNYTNEKNCERCHGRL